MSETVANLESKAEDQINRIALVLRAFKHRNYKVFFGGQIVSLVGNFLTATAMSWLVLRLTHDPWLLGVVGFASQIPMFFLAPFAGVWVDRVDRKKLIIVTQILSMVQSFALAFLALRHIITINEIMGLAVFQGLINAFDMPGRQAFLVEMVPDRSDLPNAIALNSTMVHASRVIGPAAAGLLIAYIGEGTCFFIDALSYIGVIVALIAMRVAPRKLPKPRGALRELAEGFRYVWEFVPIRVLLLVMVVLSLTGMPAQSLLMPIYGNYFGGATHGSMAFGFLAAASGVGALIGAVMLAARRGVPGLGRMISISAFVFSISLVGVALSRNFWICMLIMPISGWGMLTTFAGSNTLLQTLADDDKRGRVMSLFTMAFMGMTPFGILFAGWMTKTLGTGGADDLRGPSRTLLICAGVCILASIWFAIMLPRLRPLVRRIYARKGIIPAISAGLQDASNTAIGPAGPPTAS